MSLLLIFIIYQLLQLFLLPLVIIFLIKRKLSRRQVFGKIAHRVGCVPVSTGSTIWLHAVSVGEVLSLQQIIQDIKKQSPEQLVYVTVGTSMGYEMARKNLNADYFSYLPYDFLICLLIAFRRVKPTSLVIVEGDYWPNLIMLARFKRVPVYALNARMNKKKAAFRKRINFVLKPIFSCFEHFYVQSDYDQQEFTRLGVASGKITVLGNLKAYNVLGKQTQETLKTTKKQHKSHTVLLLGSVHPGELDGYLDMYLKLKQAYPKLKLIIAPRHFHWQQELMNKVQQTANSVDLWTRSVNHELLSEKLSSSFEINDIVVVCTLGLLFQLYQYATIFYLGGTFVPIGGHNLLEPAVWSNAIIIGPHDDNCATIANALEQKSAIARVQTFDQAYDQSLQILTHDVQQHEMGLHARRWLEIESERVAKNISKLIELLCN